MRLDFFLRRVVVATAGMAVSFTAMADADWRRIESGQMRVLRPELRIVQPISSSVFSEPVAERMAERDEAVIEAVIDERDATEIIALEEQLASILIRRYSGKPNAAAAQRQFATTVSTRLRWAYAGNPLHTELPSLRDDALASIDLVLGRQIARYANAVVDGDRAAQVAILAELQNGLLVLSADQVEEFANRLGSILHDETRRLSAAIKQTETQQAALLAVLNPALLVFDTIKHRGPNTLYTWLRANRREFETATAAPGRLYTFDRIAGVMVGFDRPADILENLDELLDPGNIAWGYCGLGQMAAAGLRSGSFACAMGPQCRAETPELARIPRPRLKRGLSDRRINKPGKRGNSGLLSPYGVSADAMQGNCSTSAAGALAAGSPGMSGGGLGAVGNMNGFAGCLADAAYRDALAGSQSQCYLRAAQKLRDARRNETIVVDQGPNGPMIRGAYGAAGCETDPHMVGPGVHAVGPQGEVDTDYIERELRRSAATMSRVIDEFARKLEDESHTNGRLVRIMTDAVAGRHLSEDEYARIAQDVRQNTDICVADCKDGEYGHVKCIGRSRASDCNVAVTINGEAHFDYGWSCGSDCEDELYRTLVHEVAAHASGIVGKQMGEYNRKSTEEGIQREHDRYDAAYDGVMAGAGTKAAAERIAEQIRQGREQPNPLDPPRMCGPVAEAYRDMMQCAAGQMAGIDSGGNPIPMPGVERQPDEPGLGNTAGNVDPGQQQWLNAQYGDNVFARCTREQGITVAGRDGSVYSIGGERGLPSGQQCGALDCRPPARARSVNGFCRCVVSGAGAIVQTVIERQEMLRTCAVMTVSCDRSPGSPCCSGPGADIAPGIDPVTPVDPTRFDPDPARRPSAPMVD